MTVTGGESRGSPPSGAHASAQLVVPRSIPIVNSCDKLQFSLPAKASPGAGQVGVLRAGYHYSS